MTDFTRTLCILAHPDDEALGCGGLLSLLTSPSYATRVVILCSSVQKRDTPFEVDSIHAHFYQSLDVLGVSSSALLDFPNLALNTLPQSHMVEAIENQILSFNPTVIITHDVSDLNIDHQCLSRAVVVASRLYHRRSSSVSCPTVLTCEIPSSTEWNIGNLSFVPNLFIPLPEYALDTKINACFKYPDVMRKRPHSRSLEYISSLALIRGSQSNTDYAEAYSLLFDSIQL